MLRTIGCERAVIVHPSVYGIDNRLWSLLDHRDTDVPGDGEIVLNDAYREMAAHYSAAVLPGRRAARIDVLRAITTA